jgi:hypothetical protein
MHDQLVEALEGIPDDVAERITWRNVAELYGLDPPPAARTLTRAIHS